MKWLLVALLLAGCASPADPALDLPSGATIVYSNLGGTPVRTFRLAGCLFTEEWSQGGQWLLSDKVAIACPAGER